jgi:hypothetical protein
MQVKLVLVSGILTLLASQMSAALRGQTALCPSNIIPDETLWRSFDTSGAPARCSRMLAYAHVCSRMLTNAHICSHMLTYAHVCSRLLTYAQVCSRVCWRMLTCVLSLCRNHRCSSRSPPPPSPATTSAAAGSVRGGGPADYTCF